MARLALLAALLLTAGALPANATVANQNMRVRQKCAKPAARCRFRMNNTNFGTYEPLGANRQTPLSVVGTMTVACNLRVEYSITADNGIHSAHTFGQCASGPCTRAFGFGPYYTPYDLYTSAQFGTVWNARNPISGIASGSSDRLDFYGYVPAGLAEPPGNYADTVVATIAY